MSERDKPTGPAPPPQGRARWHGWWERFRHSPYLPATVLLLILAVAAGLFAGSYTYILANPTPHRIPVAVVDGGVAVPAAGRSFLDGMNGVLNGSLHIMRYPSTATARDAVQAQQVFAILDVRSPERVPVEVSGASGSSVAEVVSGAAAQAGQQARTPVAVTDINPLQRGDPRGLAIFYITLAAVIIGFVGAIQLGVHARALGAAQRIAFTVAYALLGGFAIAAVVDWWLGALSLPFVRSWAILSFTMFTSGMIFSMFSALFGRWAMIPTWGVMVLLGNPSSGGAVSWPLLPSVLGAIGRWLPPGASVNAQHTAVYFRGHQHVFPYLVLAGWALVACAVFWVRRDRRDDADGAD
ncbi:ABC transporter permease [Nocardia spumae]|uniref:ABC transporter permease n=1 Tax=Nocardia spumae TaxID=2887190 RepID=UPI001D147EF2|nr:ABC transporter permease [Nocardia spumae]